MSSAILAAVARPTPEGLGTVAARFRRSRLAALSALGLLGATLSAANVVLAAVGAALFLTAEGPDQMPWFYIMLAAVAIPVASALSGCIDNWPRLRVFQVVLIGAAGIMLAVYAMILLDVPAIFHAVYLASYVLDILIDILFWVLVAEYLTADELRRHTAAMGIAVAAGGMLGGGLMSLLLDHFTVQDMLLAVPIILVVVAGQLGLVECLVDRPAVAAAEEEDEDDAEAGMIETFRFIPRLIAHHPIILLIGLSMLLMPMLYCLQEYLFFRVYAVAFDSEDALAGFLGLMAVFLQLAELVLLWFAGRCLLAADRPVLRNLVFPATTLLSLLGGLWQLQMPAGIAMHINGDAVSNAVFDPVRTLNYSAIPARYLGRVRTLGDGICYPAGFALAGLFMLLTLDHLADGQLIGFALAVAAVFTAINLAIGLMLRRMAGTAAGTALGEAATEAAAADQQPILVPALADVPRPDVLRSDVLEFGQFGDHCLQVAHIERLDHVEYLVRRRYLEPNGLRVDVRKAGHNDNVQLRINRPDALGRFNAADPRRHAHVEEGNGERPLLIAGLLHSGNGMLALAAEHGVQPGHAPICLVPAEQLALQHVDLARHAEIVCQVLEDRVIGIEDRLLVVGDQDSMAAAIGGRHAAFSVMSPANGRSTWKVAPVPRPSLVA